MAKRKTTIEAVRDCGDRRHQVISLRSEGGDPVARKEPCEECPWRKDSPIGAFPAEAYRFSANTAYDMARSTFACHMNGKQKPATCAGFLMNGSFHNMAVRMHMMEGLYNYGDTSDGGLELYESYRAMAEANGVDPADPVLDKCRGNNYD